MPIADSTLFFQDECGSVNVRGMPNFLNSFLNAPLLKVLWLSECRDGGKPTIVMNVLIIAAVAIPCSYAQGKNALNLNLFVYTVPPINHHNNLDPT